MKDREMAKSMRASTLSEPDDMKSNVKASKDDSGVICIYDNKNYGVGSVISNPDGREFTCSADGTWQTTKK